MTSRLIDSMKFKTCGVHSELDGAKLLDIQFFLVGSSEYVRMYGGQQYRYQFPL